MKHGLTIAVAIAVATSLIACKQEEAAPPPKPVQVNLLEIKRDNQAQEFTYSGTIDPENTALVSFAVPGVIENVAVEEGQPVKQGQLLAGIDDTEYRNALFIAEAALTQAEDMYNRLSGLYSKGSLPEKDFIDIQTKVAQARANKEINVKHIKDSRLTAPFTGIISRKMIERGSTAAPGIPAFQIVKTDQVYARIAVPEGQVGEVLKGMASGVFVKTLNQTFNGNITIINPQADPVAKTYDVKVKLDNASGRLLPGMIADVTIHTGKKVEVIIIPAKAIVRDADGIAYVFTANKEGTALRKRVEVKAITGENELIVTGLNLGDKIVIAGQSRLKEGMPLTASL
ncbi:efflux RND transporter periplasmic adaptor subunit [Ohtaekwangia sp.]|uniref:efflux RND transporter periplasmic adaptor subunit n=1 Tax=Ohtaekwangia sp. TaxID=2066019 RepID=UPI002FDDC415